MKALTSFCLLVFSCTSLCQQGSKSAMATPKFEAVIRTSKSSYQPNEEVELQFELTNINEQDYYVLKWNTPLEGIRNDYLDIQRDGVEVMYRGIMVKRGNPTADSYVLVAAGSTAKASVKLNNAYDLSETGDYRVVWRAFLLDVIEKHEGEEFVPGNLNQGFNPVELSANSISFVVDKSNFIRPKPVFKILATTPKFFYEPGEDVELHFELTNENDESYYILVWQTPFEGFYGDYLDVTVLKNNVTTDLMYKGPVVKYGRPTASSYLPLQSKTTIKTAVTLNDVYDLSRAGIYHVGLKMELMDVQEMNLMEEFHPTFRQFNNVPLKSDFAVFVVQDVYS